MNNIVRKRIEIFAKLLIGSGLIIFLVIFVKPNAIAETFGMANLFYLGAALLLLPLNLFLQYYKWKILCKKYFNIQKSRPIWLSLFYGISGGIFTPMKSGEYIARALPLKEVKAFDVFMATAVDKLIPIIFVLTIGGSFFIIYLKELIHCSNITIIIAFMSYLGIILIPVLLFLGKDNKSLNLRAKLKKVKFIGKFIEKISFIRSMDRQTFGKLIIISLLYHLAFTSQMVLLLSAFSDEFNFIIFFFGANLIVFTQIVIPPIALGELGIREGAAVYYLQNLGYPAAVGFNAAFSLFTINLLIPSIIGLFLLLKRN